MTDPRMTKLADVLINYSTELKPGEKVLIEAIDVPHEITCELVRVARKAGAEPLVTLKSNRVLRAMLIHGSEVQLKLIAEVEAARMKQVQAYIGLRGSLNVSELSDVAEDKMKAYQALWWRPVHGEIRVRHTRWVVCCAIPAANPMAQLARMSTAGFEDFYFDVCTMDYRRLSQAMRPLQQRLQAADKVKITGPRHGPAFLDQGSARHRL